MIVSSRVTRLFTTGTVALIVVALSAQHENPAFEVASVKPTKMAGQTFTVLSPGGRFRAVNTSTRFLIRRAYQLQDGAHVLGGPKWLDDDTFDIEAKAEGDPAPAQVMLMLRTLLAERFKLTLHTETREMPIYALRVARSDGRVGSQPGPSSTTACANPPPPGNQIVASDRSHPFCGVLYSPVGYWTGRHVRIETLASALSRIVGRMVVDRTGVTNPVDVDLRWTDVAALLSPAVNSTDPPPLADGPSLFTALEEQLGLKLESTNGPVNVLLIDQVEHPTEN